MIEAAITVGCFLISLQNFVIFPEPLTSCGYQPCGHCSVQRNRRGSSALLSSMGLVAAT